ncbi:L-rhamnose-binding lectin CSL2-like, partial [Scomber scombrus]
KTLTCDLETSTQKLYCGYGLIVVQNVAVSHRETESCVSGVRPDRLDPPLCSSTPVLHIAQHRCDGKHKCSVRASNHIFANVCPGTRKYLQYSYTCVDPGTVQFMTQNQSNTETEETAELQHRLILIETKRAEDGFMSIRGAKIWTGSK